MGRREDMQVFGGRKRECLGDIGVDGRIILKRILKKYEYVGIRFMWLRIGRR
jgi:hypothetical protein